MSQDEIKDEISRTVMNTFHIDLLDQDSVFVALKDRWVCSEIGRAEFDIAIGAMITEGFLVFDPEGAIFDESRT